MGYNESRVGTTCGIAHLGDQTVGTLFNDLRMLYIGHATGNVRQLDQMIRVGVARAVMPTCSVESIPEIEDRARRGNLVGKVINDRRMVQMKYSGLAIKRGKLAIKTGTNVEDLVHGRQEVQGERYHSKNISWERHGSARTE
jgi:hypothetical protein